MIVNFEIFSNLKITFEKLLVCLIYLLAHTVKPVYNSHHWDPKKVAVVQRWPAFGGFSIKTALKISLPRLVLAAVYRWPLFRGSR